jgi:hypothetical protein
MAKNESVTLDLKVGPASGTGWHETKPVNGQVYSFKYKGGHNDDGGLKTTVGEGTATIALTLDTDDRYSLDSVCFASDVNNQLSWSPTNASSGTITDINSLPEDAHYTVYVIDSQNPGGKIECDPMIHNDPKGGTARILHT